LTKGTGRSEKGNGRDLAAGVIGQVLKTAPHYATILLITDYNSAVDSIVQRTGRRPLLKERRKPLPAEIPSSNRRGRCRGCRRHLRVGWNFPKGLMVGEIKEVDKKGHGVFQYAELTPSVDLTKLEEVFVVMEPISPPPPAREEKVKKGKKIKK